MAWGDGWLGAGGVEGAAGGLSFVYLVSFILCVSCIVSFRLFFHLSILFPALFLSFVSCIEDDAVAQDVPIDRHQLEQAVAKACGLIEDAQAQVILRGHCCGG